MKTPNETANGWERRQPCLPVRGFARTAHARLPEKFMITKATWRTAFGKDKLLG
jgi:hypothetical protein